MRVRKATRRQFLQRAGATATAAVAFPHIVPSSALGKDGAVAPSNRIAMGWIGTGGQGRGLMGIFMGWPEAQVVAACDVDRVDTTAISGAAWRGARRRPPPPHFPKLPIADLPWPPPLKMG